MSLYLTIYLSITFSVNYFIYLLFEYNNIIERATNILESISNVGGIV